MIFKQEINSLYNYMLFLKINTNQTTYIIKHLCILTLSFQKSFDKI